MPYCNFFDNEKSQGLLRLGLGNGLQLWPCTAPVVRPQVLAWNRAQRLLFDLDATLGRDGGLSICHLREVGEGDAQLSGKG